MRDETGRRDEQTTLGACFTALSFRKAKYIFKVSQDALGELKMKYKQ